MTDIFADFTKLSISNIEEFKYKSLLWADRFKVFTCLDSHNLSGRYGKYDFVLGIDALEEIYNDVDADELQQWSKDHFVFGFMTFESKTKFQNPNKPSIDYWHSYFFKPRYIIIVKENSVYLNRNLFESQDIIEQILKENIKEFLPEKLDFKTNVSETEYLDNINTIKEKIRQGAFYELNYCIEFVSKSNGFKAVENYYQLSQKAQSPMSSLFKCNSKYCLSFSPERFVANRNSKLIAQPIKGTRKRNLDNPLIDEELKKDLENSKKDRAENIMIVDLMRNDLTHYAKTGSIQVDELCKIYSFPFVHQMISTISAELTDNTKSIQALFDCLPVGSMTGTPKLEVEKNIAKLEKSQRGLYSGIMMFIEPNGDFDSSVIIRSLLFDSESGKLSLSVGGAITLLSDAQEEYHECLTKAEGIINFFS